LRPELNDFGSAMVATSALASTGPTAGTPINRLHKYIVSRAMITLPSHGGARRACCGGFAGN
jgi:hypothetical protein